MIIRWDLFIIRRGFLHIRIKTRKKNSGKFSKFMEGGDWLIG
mgnify:CR=1 FL=1